MELNEFVKHFADQFDEVDPEDINADTAFHDVDEWCSMIALSVVNMVEKKCGKTITFDELKACVTIEDVYNLTQK